MSDGIIYYKVSSFLNQTLLDYDGDAMKKLGGIHIIFYKLNYSLIIIISFRQLTHMIG